MNIGIVQNLIPDLEQDFKKLKDYGFQSCQLVCWNKELMTDNIADRINKVKEELSIEITAFWCGWSKPAVWDFYEGPITLGIVPTAYRAIRTDEIIKGSDFAKKINVKNIVTHVGFIPEDPNDEKYKGTLSAIKLIAKHCKDNGQNFLFETGQETPIVLLRTIQDINLDNIGINFDPANLLLYGKANPIDAVDILGKYIMGVHAKDGEYPTDGYNLGKEKPIGKGRVNFNVLIKKLKEYGYDGSITIENEMNDEKQLTYILESKEFLEKIINSI
ncbi:MAG: sugar phosphate isomerase/epimerase [Caloramator sp.]|nr:sugar phosphate isomerase/epimerase [Caloramator sp.]